jgi:hypothetical protein
VISIRDPLAVTLAEPLLTVSPWGFAKISNAKPSVRKGETSRRSPADQAERKKEVDLQRAISITSQV